MLNRFDYERAVAGSDLPPLSRLVLVMVMFAADWPGGKVPQRYGRSLTDLASATGMARSSVASHLNRLERAGWITRKRPPVERARSMKERTEYRLKVPAGASPSPGLEASPSPGLASPAAGHKPDLFQNLPEAAAREVITEKTGATEEEAMAIVKRIRTEKEPRNLVALIWKMATDGDLMQMLSDYREARLAERNVKLIEEARKGPECIHGTPGGAFVNPRHGVPLCPDCRRNVARATA